MSRFIIGERGEGRGKKLETAKKLEDGDRWFWPYCKPRHVSNYVAHYKKHGLKLRTRVEVINGVWGTLIEKGERCKKAG